MKNALLFFALLLLCTNISAQDKFTLKIRDTKGQAVKNTEVVAFNETANDRVTGITDANGAVTLILTKVGVYKFSYLEVKDFESYEVIEGMTGTFSRSVTYDPQKIFVPKPKADRSGLTFTSTPGHVLKGKPGIMKLTLLVTQTNNIRVPGVDLAVVSIENKIKYTGRSDAKGESIFYIPAGKSYEIDVDGNEALKTVDLPNDPMTERMQVVYYEKTKVTEIAKGDTIIQRNITQTNGTNTHLLFTLKLLNFEGEPLEGEAVYLKADGQKRVYEGVTNEKGECKLMLSKSANYILNVKYEQGLYLVEAKNSIGFGQESLTRRYRGSKEIERILAEQVAEMKRLEEEEKLLKARREEEERIYKLNQAEREKAQKEFMEQKRLNEKELVETFYTKKLTPHFNETPVRTATAPTNYITRNMDGYSIDFGEDGVSCTPTVVNDKMYLTEGYYSPLFYCLKAENGQFAWGVELGESGASPAVYHNGVLLINTESCTLYALDAVTGKFLWSKWLSNYLYSTPTADGDKVYVVHDYGGSFVLSCFNLNTGQFLWINRLDSKVIACPVVEGNEVHVASQSGFYYIFDKTSGKPIEVITSLEAVSSPTLTETSIFLTATINDKDQLVEMDRKTYKIKKQYDTQLNSFNTSWGLGLEEQMNFNGTHPIVYKNKYVVLLDHENLYVFDALSESLLWQKPVSVTTSQVPIVANDRILLAGTDGKIISYDISSGNSTEIKNTTGKITAQPVCSKGLLFIASSGVLTVIKGFHNFDWNQWNKDAGHNLNIK